MYMKVKYSRNMQYHFWKNLRYYFITRMHSSRMRTARFCPYLPACTAPGEPAWGVYQPGGCTCPGGVPARGVYLPGMYLPRGCTCPGTPRPPVNRILDTHYWKYYLAPTSLRVVTRMHSSMMRTIRSSSHVYPSKHWAVYPRMHWAGRASAQGCLPGGWQNDRQV